jgi:hypothetical protein
MKFKEEYPGLFQFFAGYFPDADLFNQSGIEVVRQFKHDSSKEELICTKNEIKKLIPEISIFWKEISTEATRYFNSIDDAGRWIEIVDKELNAE